MSIEGYTYLIDIWTQEIDLLMDQDLIRRFLYNCVSMLGLKPLADSIIIRTFPISSRPKEVGVSGLIILTESHLAIHTWPEHGYARIELSSCRKVNQEQLEHCLLAFFLPQYLAILPCPWNGHSTKKSTNPNVSNGGNLQ